MGELTSDGTRHLVPPAARYELAEALGADSSLVQTNIVVLDVNDAASVAAKAAADGVLVSALGPRFMRLVTHLDVDDAAIERAIQVLGPLVSG